MSETLFTILLALILNAAFIIGLHGVTRDGYLLGFVRKMWIGAEGRFWEAWAAEYERIGADNEMDDLHLAGWLEANPEPPKPIIPDYANPLTECPTCMASVWGLAGYLSLYAILGLPWPYLFGAAHYCLALAGLIYSTRKAWGGE